jgi:hypothetical protein
MGETASIRSSQSRPEWDVMVRFLDKHERLAIKLLILAVVILNGLAVFSVVR